MIVSGIKAEKKKSEKSVEKHNVKITPKVS